MPNKEKTKIQHIAETTQINTTLLELNLNSLDSKKKRSIKSTNRQDDNYVYNFYSTPIRTDSTSGKASTIGERNEN